MYRVADHDTMRMSTMKLCPDCGAELSFPEGICPKCLLFVPIWWGATMVWSAIRQYDPTMSLFEDSGRPSKILGFTSDSKRFSSSGLFIISVALPSIPVYLGVLSPSDHRFSYFLAGLTAWMTSLFFVFFVPIKIKSERSIFVVRLASLAFLALFVLQSHFFPAPVRLLAAVAMCLMLSGLSGAALGCFVRRRRGGVKGT